MVITRETDYALRILRALLDGELHAVGEIAQAELLPQAFAYKILKKLEKAGLLEIRRGTAGGCRLTADLDQTSLYDLMLAMGERSDLCRLHGAGLPVPLAQQPRRLRRPLQAAGDPAEAGRGAPVPQPPGDPCRTPDRFFALKLDKFYQV